jgi:hypothetical protein
VALLSEEVVRVVTEGVVQAEQQLDQVRQAASRLGATQQQAQQVARQYGRAVADAVGPSVSQRFFRLSLDLRRVREMFSGIAQVARGIAFGGSAGIIGVITGAAKGTVEATQFSRAMELLTRTIGDAFAPYVRAATQGLIDLANWFKGLTQETKDSIAQWALITAGVAGFVSFLPVMIGGLSGVVAAIGALLSPIGLAVAGFAALVAGTVYLFDTFGGGVDVLNETGKAVSSWGNSFLKVLRTLAVEAAKFWNQWVSFADPAITWVAEQMIKLGTAPGGLREELLKNVREGGPVARVDVGNVGVQFDEIVRKGRAAAGDFAGNIQGAIAGVQALFAHLKGNLAAANFGQGFNRVMPVTLETSQGTFERLSKGLAQNDMDMQQRQWEAVKRVGDLLEAGKVIWQGIKDALPVVRGG